MTYEATRMLAGRSTDRGDPPPFPSPASGGG